MSDIQRNDISRSQKINALLNVVRFKPKFTVLIIGIGLISAFLEGVGLSFILPVIEIVQTENPGVQADGLLGIFVTVYQAIGIPFTLAWVVVGVAIIMTLRYTTSFLVAWFRAALRMDYMRDLQLQAFENALNARVEYYDQEGSDDILNAIITQSFYAGKVIHGVVILIEMVFLSLVYFLIALVISPLLTMIAVGVLGGLTLILRHVVEPGYVVGENVADANELRQQSAQAGTQGIRDVRIFGLAEELYQEFVDAVDQYTAAGIRLHRNEAAINKLYNLGVAVSVFVLIYLSLEFTNLAFGELGVFLFAMFQLGPKVSSLNEQFYNVENNLPHLVRTQDFIQNLERQKEPCESTRDVPSEVQHVEFDDVWFSYNGEEQVLRGLDFEFEKDDFIAFVGQSGAGKSTIVSLLARLYEVEEGEIRANGIPIAEMDIYDWRDQISIVRQDPFIFNDTLRYNLTIGNRSVSEAQIDRVCEITRVDEFLDDLPDGYDTELGDDGVRLSGGQKQRVSLARALLEDTELLILDEATSDLDSNLEQEVQTAIETMDRDYAILVIAHRLSTVENADRIYAMSDGRIVEMGTHSELIENGGEYEKLYSIQSK